MFGPFAPTSAKSLAHEPTWSTLFAKSMKHHLVLLRYTFDISGNKIYRDADEMQSFKARGKGALTPGRRYCVRRTLRAVLPIVGMGEFQSAWIS
jgi:hypothetical protein